jgi:D-tyrosyl-tRNA(Tyr) deacylase
LARDEELLQKINNEHPFLAAPSAQAEELFRQFVQLAGATGLEVATGHFQQYMQVEIHNDGPVTILLDSREKL